MITGFDADEIHDISDDVAIAETTELVLTSSVSFGPRAALDFLNTRCPEKPCSSKYLIAVSDSVEKEDDRLAEMKQLTDQ